ncbi:peptidoglycan-binding protein, partial [Hydrogenibacillus schlegelii]|uniref:peptidoglycan-binding protein n=1 Tax=Hydrogenibacillus schlegelii TaxID=1484 RepID=UPI0034A05473
GAQPAENGGWGASRAAAFGKGTLRVGARGGDVYELQGRLKYHGYYTGPVDGVFGWRTYWAVRNFQYRFGLRVDGAVGPATKAKLYAATRGWRPTAPATPARKARFAGPVLRGGARGGAVFDVQGRLKFLGYYKGPERLVVEHLSVPGKLHDISCAVRRARSWASPGSSAPAGASWPGRCSALSRSAGHHPAGRPADRAPAPEGRHPGGHRLRPRRSKAPGARPRPIGA